MPEYLPYFSVQAEVFLFSAPTFLEALDLKCHMPGHFFLYKVVCAYPSGPIAYFCANGLKVPRGKRKRLRGKNDPAYESLGQKPPEKWGQRKEKLLPVH